MSNAGYRFAIVLYREDDQRRLAQVPIAPDWEPAFEHLRFLGIRRGLRPPVMTTTPATVVPVWHHRLGSPVVEAFRLEQAGDPPLEDELPTAYVSSFARQLLAELIEAGTVSATDPVRFVVVALPDERPPALASNGWGFEDVAQPLAIHPTPWTDIAGARSRHVDAAWDADDLPVLIAQALIDQTHVLSERAGSRETGGVMAGLLHRDPTDQRLFLEITAQLPARHTIATDTRLTFTDDTWAAAREDIARRQRGELLAGFWHLHPDFCRNCPPSRRETCSLNSTFFSQEDVHLHRVCFNQGYAVALLVSQRPTGLTTALYGWRRGAVVARSFHVTGARPVPTYEEGDPAHASPHPTV